MARRTLGLPARVHPVAAIPLGWPMGHYGPTTRAPVEAVTHLDRYGNQPYRAPSGRAVQPPEGLQPVSRATMAGAE
jgi:hypothetical protein